MLACLFTIITIGLPLFIEGAELDTFNPAFKFFNATPRSIFIKDNGLTSKLPKTPHHLSIVHGEPAAHGQFCYIAYLQFSDGKSAWSCGGSLVNPSTILTAAHCVLGAVSAVAVLGGLDLSQPYEPGRIVTRISRSGLTVHEKYNENNFYNDIGLVKMRKPVSLSKYVCSVQLPSCSSNHLNADSDNNNDYTVSGWGKTSDDTQTSKLMYVNVSGEAQASCVNYYKHNAYYQVIETQMCTSGTSGKSTCNGDSGGPLVQPDSSGNFIQQGIVSLGMNSCQMSAPSIYTHITFFTSWLCPRLNNS